jgi:hypothetical protein
MGSNINSEIDREKIAYEHYKDEFKDYEPEAMAKNTGCIYNRDTGEIIVKLMGQELSVKYPSGDIYGRDGAELEGFHSKILILRYLIHGSGVEPSKKYITYREIEGGNVYYGNFYGRCILRLSSVLKNNPEGLKKAFEKLDAEKVNRGDFAYKIQFLNNIYLIFIFWIGDDEFPPSSQILFNENVHFYFTAEDLAVVGDVSIGTLKKIGVWEPAN